jgi:hypothetical protein
MLSMIWDYLQEEWCTCEFFSIVQLFTGLSCCALFIKLVSWTVQWRISCTSVVNTEISSILHVSRKQRWYILLCKWRDIFSSYQWCRSSPPPPKKKTTTTKRRGAGGPSGPEYELCWGLNFGLNSVLLKEGSILDRSDITNKVPPTWLNCGSGVGGLICYLHR